MRFVFAIVASVVAAVLLGLGLGQRTIWAPPSSLDVKTSVSDEVKYAVIDGEALTANPGRQTLTVKGTGTIFMAYGRTSDVEAWIGDSPFAAISIDEKTKGIVAKTKTNDAVELDDDVAEADAAVVDPAGSDLWLEEFTGTDVLVVPISVPSDMSVIVASDGTDPAPASIGLSWPLDDSTPWAGPLLAAGGLVLLIGLILYVWAFVHMRRQRGPRRKGPQGKRPKLPRSSRYRPNGQAALGIAPKDKRATRGFIAVPVIAVSALALSACSSDYWPDLSSTPAVSTPTPTPTPGAPDEESVVPPAVTTAQAEEIMTRVSEVATAADSALDATALAKRFTGAALQIRSVNYKIRTAAPETPASQAIPASKLTLVLPQATTAWPRVLTTVVQNESDDSVPPIAVMMSQASPRADYLVEYAIALEADATIPDVAPASVGTSIVAPDSKLMVLAPGQVSAAYADILAVGDASQYAGLFNATGDTLRPQIGADYKASRKANLPSTASIEFSSSAGEGPEIALATNDSGALVAVSLNETETVRPVEAGATVSTEGASKALSGVQTTTTGIQTTYAHELLFYIPSIGSKEKIVLLGYSVGLVSAVQLP